MRPVLHADCPRAKVRRSVQTPCEVVRARDYSLVGTRAIDLSTKGMLLEIDTCVLTGEELLVLFRSPSGDWYDYDGTVARVLHGRRHRDERRAIGIAFDPLDPWPQILLSQALPPPPPPPRPATPPLSHPP